MLIKACLFDLDGVIVDTAKYHYKAWRRLANTLGFDFSEEENERLKGVSRMESLDIILGLGGLQATEAQKVSWAEQKNAWYVEFIQSLDASEVLPGAREFLEEVRAAGIRVVLGSASKNAQTILERLSLDDHFDYIVDGHKTTRPKPDPQVFLLGSAAVGCLPEEAIVFEDAVAGIDAALAGGFWAVGIGDPAVLGKAHLVLPGFAGMHLADVLRSLEAKIAKQA